MSNETRWLRRGLIRHSSLVIRHSSPVSVPAKPAKGAEKRRTAPENEEADSPCLRGKRGSLENNGPKSVIELRKRQGLNQRLQSAGKSIRREKDSREQPHRQHRKVHQA